MYCDSRSDLSIKSAFKWRFRFTFPKTTLTTSRHAVLMALRHPAASHPTVCYTPYGLFWCVWVSVGCVYHVFGLRDSCQSIQGETCRLNTLSRALYLTPGWFNSTPFTHIHTPIHKHAHTYTPTSPVIHQYLHQGLYWSPPSSLFTPCSTTSGPRRRPCRFNFWQIYNKAQVII